jgi:hypothetical protein
MAMESKDIRDAIRSPIPPTFRRVIQDDWLRPKLAFARAWGSRLVTFERAGRLNVDAGFGPWPEGRRLRAELTRSEGHQS